MAPRRISLCIAAALLLPLCALPLAAAAASGTEISSSVILFFLNDIDVHQQGAGDYGSRCIEMVYRAKDSGAAAINFVPTHYFIQAQANSVGHYCYMERWAPANETPCVDFTSGAVSRFRAGMESCFRKAVEMGLDISVTPHLDDGLMAGAWRNSLVMDPLAKHQNASALAFVCGNSTNSSLLAQQGGGVNCTWPAASQQAAPEALSYYDIMMRPLAQALSAAITNATRVYFAMQGEMSATVFRHPRRYTQLVPIIKSDIAANRTDIDPANILVGISTNFNKLCACVLVDLVDPSQYLRQYPSAIKPRLGEFDLPGIRQLLSEVDLIGISSYAAIPVNFTLADLENAIWQFDQEISHFGVDLKKLLHEEGKLLILSEYGLGGGIAHNGSLPALTAAQAAATPFFGVVGGYNRSTDPWATYEPEDADVATRAFRRHFYVQTSRWLLAGGSPNYPVAGAFLWNMASWDVQAVHSSSTTSEGSYRDEAVVRRIQLHNRLVQDTASSDMSNARLAAASSAAAAAGQDDALLGSAGF